MRLQERDTRTSASQIAAMVGDSEEEVARSNEECERRGIIRRCKTVIDRERAGVERVFACIGVKVAARAGVRCKIVAK